MFNTAPGLNAGQVDFAFSQKGFKNWSTSTTKFKKHQNSISHNFSMTAYHNFSNCKPIDVTLNESRLVLLAPTLSLLLSRLSPCALGQDWTRSDGGDTS